MAQASSPGLGAQSAPDVLAGPPGPASLDDVPRKALQDKGQLC